MGRTVFDLYNVKIFFIEFHFIFSFEKIKEYVTPCCRLQRGFLKTHFLLILD